jgi:uncharacterized PurR-regulated membrane protein YhhQ (DUF165 family)
MRRSAGTVSYTRSGAANEGVWSEFTRSLLAISRLVFPVLLLATIGAAAFIYGGEPVRWLGDPDVGGKSFTTGLLALPLTFFVVQLTNRRYGAGYAFGQVLVTGILALAAGIYARDDLTLLRSGIVPDFRLMAAFGGALFSAHCVAIFVFDRLRGPQWWQAPLFASLLGGIVLASSAYPAAYAGTAVLWVEPMFAYMGVAAAAALGMVVPYWMLRSLIEPLSGFGGY